MALRRLLCGSLLGGMLQQMKASCATYLSHRNDTARAVYDSLIDCRANLKVRVAAARLLMCLCATSL